MKTLARAGLVTFGAALVASAYAAGAARALRFSDYGFSINPLVGHAEDTNHQVVTLMLPTVDTFAANVGVQLQPYNGTMENYVKVSEDQFIQVGAKVIRKKVVSPGEGLFEVTGLFQGREMHWYARAKLAKGKVFLATATGSESQWAAQSAMLQACVDSLSLLP